MNYVTISGNLTRQPELRYVSNDVANASFGVAVDRSWKDRETGQFAESTSFFEAVCWGELAEHVALSANKGTRVVVSGRLEQKSWTDESGMVRSRVQIVADDIAMSLKFRAINEEEWV